jgi:cytochrome c peroxidase
MKTISNLLVLGIILFVFSDGTVNSSAYSVLYNKQVELLKTQQIQLYKIISNNKLSDSNSLFQIRKEINRCRTKLKAADFWLRYLEPVLYKKINGPLPVEWETEVFEKYEPPYKREGAGLSLAWQYLNGEDLKKDSLLKLISKSMNATDAYKADSNAIQLKTHHAFFLCNRLYLLNLASIYTTGFECPDQQQIIPELRQMLAAVEEIYTAYNSSFPNYPLTKNYSDLFQNTIDFVQRQPADFTNFDHFSFLKNYVNPLFALNQQFISAYSVISRSNMDYSLNNTTTSIFDKSLFFAQYPKGVYYRINNPVLLKQIDSIGKLLFYDPVLSVNNQRSCASCHKPTQFFTDTTAATAIQLNKTDPLTRNTPTLLNTVYNHLIHLDGKHLSLQEQAIGVITNSIEMGSEKEEVLKKILSCGGYKKTFQDLLKQK